MVRGFVTCLALATTVIGLVGCASTSPRIPKAVDYDNALTMYSTNTFGGDLAKYRSAFEKGDTNRATRLRDAMIQRIRVEIEINYRQFELSLFSSRATFATGADWVELGLAGATTITGGEHAKTVLAGILTALKGGRLSVDKNWFREKTTETIISSMQAERSKKLLLITGKMAAGDAMHYTFEEAWADLVDYFYAGTLEAGIQALAVETGKTAADAKGDFQKAEKKRIDTLAKASIETIITVEKLTDRLGQLFDKKDEQEAKRVVDELKIERAPGKTDFDLLRDAIDALKPDDKAELARFAKAFKTTK